MTLYSFLPLLKGWMYQYVEKDGTLKLGEEKFIDRVEAPGWALAWSAIVKGSLDGKYVRVHVEIDGPDRAFPIDFTPYGMKEFGAVSPINYGGFLTRYDDTNKVYAGAISPAHPMPFSKRLEIKLIPPTAPIEETSSLPITYKVVYILAKIIDEKAFRRSLLELLRT
jgi:hypothetical protein